MHCWYTRLVTVMRFVDNFLSLVIVDWCANQASQHIDTTSWLMVFVYNLLFFLKSNPAVVKLVLLFFILGGLKNKTKCSSPCLWAAFTNIHSISVSPFLRSADTWERVSGRWSGDKPLLVLAYDTSCGNNTRNRAPGNSCRSSAHDVTIEIEVIVSLLFNTRIETFWILYMLWKQNYRPPPTPSSFATRKSVGETYPVSPFHVPASHSPVCADLNGFLVF